MFFIFAVSLIDNPNNKINFRGSSIFSSFVIRTSDNGTTTTNETNSNETIRSEGSEEKIFFGVGDVLENFFLFLYTNPWALFLSVAIFFFILIKLFFYFEYPDIHVTSFRSGKSIDIGRYINEEQSPYLKGYNIIRFKHLGKVSNYYSICIYKQLANLEWFSFGKILSYCAFVTHKKLKLKFYLKIPEKTRKSGLIGWFRFWILYRVPSFLLSSRRISIWLKNKVVIYENTGNYIEEIDVLQPLFMEDKITTVADIEYKKWIITKEGRKESDVIIEDKVPLHLVEKIKKSDLVVPESVVIKKEYKALETIDSIAECIQYQQSIQEMRSINDIKQRKLQNQIRELSDENAKLRDDLIAKNSTMQMEIAKNVSEIMKKSVWSDDDLVEYTSTLLKMKRNGASIQEAIEVAVHSYLNIRDEKKSKEIEIENAVLKNRLEFVERLLSEDKKKVLHDINSSIAAPNQINVMKLEDKITEE